MIDNWLPEFTQFFFADICLGGVMVLIALSVGIMLSRLLWFFALRGSFGDE